MGGGEYFWLSLGQVVGCLVSFMLGVGCSFVSLSVRPQSLGLLVGRVGRFAFAISVSLPLWKTNPFRHDWRTSSVSTTWSESASCLALWPCSSLTTTLGACLGERRWREYDSAGGGRSSSLAVWALDWLVIVVRVFPVLSPVSSLGLPPFRLAGPNLPAVWLQPGGSLI